MSSAASRPPKSASQPVSQPASQPVEPTAASAQNGAAVGSSSDPTDGRTVGQSDEQKAKSASRLRQPPARPQLMGPPSRPQPPAPPEPEPIAAVSEPAAPAEPQRIGPISAPSERMQYRAIGLLKGKYVASEEQFNRGDIAVEDGTLIDAVLLGRVTSLIKKHIDLEQDHLWVVYPRTLYKDDESPALHVQIVGVWEPETLNADDDDDDDSAEDEPTAADPKYLSTAEAAEQCDIFSIRGEIAKYAEDKNEITVNIVQKSKSENVKPKRPFKLLVCGQLNGRATGYFWDLQVERQAGQLMLKEATQIAVVPPKKKSKDARGKGGNRRRSAPAGKPRSAGAPAPKPVPKPKSADKPADTKPVAQTADQTASQLTESKPIE